MPADSDCYYDKERRKRGRFALYRTSWNGQDVYVERPESQNKWLDDSDKPCKERRTALEASEREKLRRVAFSFAQVKVCPIGKIEELKPIPSNVWRSKRPISKPSKKAP